MTKKAELREELFRELVHRQSRFVFRIAYAVLRNVHDAEDAVQDTFLKLYRSQAWNTMRDEKAFLARTTWRIAVDKLPKRSHDVSHDEDGATEMTSSEPSPEQMAMAADSREFVHQLIDALPEELRQPLALSTVEGMSSPEIAAAMGIPEGTVRTRLMRARGILKEKLAAVLDRRYAK